MASKEAVVAGIDVGTTKMELNVYSAEGVVLERLVERNITVTDGVKAVQDPERIASVVRGFVSRALKWGAECIGLAAYRGSLLVWSLEGEPVTDVMTWMDTRPQLYWGRLPLLLRMARRLPRLGEAFSPESMTARLAALLAEKPGLAGGLEGGGLIAWNIDAFLVHRLTGQLACDSSTAALTGLINPSTLKPLGLALRALGLRGLRIPRLLPHEGLEPLPIRGGGLLGSVVGDQQAASVALDCLGEGCLKASLGTGFFLDLSTGASLRLSPGGGLIPLILYRGASRTVYGVEAYASGLGAGVEWFVKNMLGGDYEALERSLKSRRRPPIVIPYLWGSRTPRLPRGSSGVVGVMPHHSLGDVAAGIAHGVALATTVLLGELERRVGKPSKIMVTGGLSRLRGLVSLIASYTGRRLYRAAMQGSASSLGAAMLAAANCGVEFHPRIDVEPVEPGEYQPILDPSSFREASKALARLPGLPRRVGVNGGE